jgi:5-hydroxyisourate hydrolase
MTEGKSVISTHILDTSLGHPAQGVDVDLEKQAGSGWALVGKGQTNADGRIAFSCPAQPGTYRLQFHVESYFKACNTPAFFTQVPVIFSVADTGRKYHVPLLLNPFGYSTYRGS